MTTLKPLVKLVVDDHLDSLKTPPTDGGTSALDNIVNKLGLDSQEISTLSQEKLVQLLDSAVEKLEELALRRLPPHGSIPPHADLASYHGKCLDALQKLTAVHTALDNFAKERGVQTQESGTFSASCEDFKIARTADLGHRDGWESFGIINADSIATDPSDLGMVRTTFERIKRLLGNENLYLPDPLNPENLEATVSKLNVVIDQAKRYTLTKEVKFRADTNEIDIQGLIPVHQDRISKLEKLNQVQSLIDALPKVEAQQASESAPFFNDPVSPSETGTLITEDQLAQLNNVSGTETIHRLLRHVALDKSESSIGSVARSALPNFKGCKETFKKILAAYRIELDPGRTTNCHSSRKTTITQDTVKRDLMVLSCCKEPLTALSGEDNLMNHPRLSGNKVTQVVSRVIALNALLDREKFLRVINDHSDSVGGGTTGGGRRVLNSSRGLGG